MGEILVSCYLFYSLKGRSCWKYIVYNPPFREKPIQRKGLPKKRGLGQFVNLRGGLGKKEGVVFLRGLMPQCTLWSISHVLRVLKPFVQFKKCGKHPWRNVTLSKVACLHYSWKYDIRSYVNSDLSIVTIFWSLVESIGAIKKTKEILLTEKDMVFLCYYISTH